MRHFIDPQQEAASWLLWNVNCWMSCPERVWPHFLSNEAERWGHLALWAGNCGSLFHQEERMPFSSFLSLNKSCMSTSHSLTVCQSGNRVMAPFRAKSEYTLTQGLTIEQALSVCKRPKIRQPRRNSLLERLVHWCCFLQNIVTDWVSLCVSVCVTLRELAFALRTKNNSPYHKSFKFRLNT